MVFEQAECGLEGQAVGDKSVGRASKSPILRISETDRKGPSSEASLGSGMGLLKDSWIFRKIPLLLLT